MHLLGTAEFIEIAFVEGFFARGHGGYQTFSEGLELNIDRNFDLLHETFSSVGLESSGVSNGERSGRFDLELSLLWENLP